MSVKTPSQTDLPTLREAAPPLRTRLTAHQPRSRTTVHGGAAIGFGSLFLGAGVLVVLAALNVIPTDDHDFNVSRELVATIGGLLFALPGALLMLHGTAGVIAERRLARTRTVGPAWRWDHAWDPQGDANGGFGPFLRRLYAAVGFSVMLIPFHWLGAELSWPWALRMALGICDIIALVLIADAGLRLARGLRYGRCRIAYDRFPYHPGESIGLRFSISRARHFGTLRFTLRCIEEAYESTGAGNRKSERVVSYALHEQAHALSREEASWVHGMDVAVAVRIPDDAPGTALSERPPRYWELHVQGETIGPDLDERFLIPIYDRPA